MKTNLYPTETLKRNLYQTVSQNRFYTNALPNNFDKMCQQNSEEKLYQKNEKGLSTQKHLSQEGLYQKLLQETSLLFFIFVQKMIYPTGVSTKFQSNSF